MAYNETPTSERPIVNKEKISTVKNKIKNHVPKLIAAGSLVTAFVAIYITQEHFITREKELLKFLGNGPDFIAINKQLAERIENGETFGHDLAGGTRVLLSRAELRK